MDLIVFDMEWNQGSEAEKRAARSKGIPSEIIEIGAVKLNDRMEIVGRFGELIRPQVYRRLSYVTKGLSNLRMGQLRQGRPFAEVAEEFLDWCGKDYTFCSWGPSDLTELQRNMDYYGMKPLSDRPIRYYDVQKLFSIAYEDQKSRRNLEYAVDFLRLEKDVPFHRALDDAYYAAKVLQTIRSPAVFGRYSFDTYRTPKSRREEIHVTFDGYSKYISRAFADKAELLADREVLSTRCYLCHHTMKHRIWWFTPNGGKHYYSVSFCLRHGYVKGKIRVRKTDEGEVYAVKTMRLADRFEVEKIRRMQRLAEKHQSEQDTRQT